MSDVRAKEITYLNKETMKTFRRWHPQIKVNGKWAFIRDDSTRSNLQEADDEYEAMEQAIAAWRKMGWDVQDDR
jgi:hypothetical protein